MPQMQILREAQFRLIMDEFLENNKDKLGLTNEDVDSIKERVIAAFAEAFPNGVSVTEARSPQFMKKLELTFVSAIAMERDPNLKLDLSVMLKERRLITDEDLRNAYRELLTHINRLRPEPKRVSKDKIEAAVDELMKGEKEQVLDELAEYIKHSTITALELEKILTAQASLTDGVDRFGFFREMSVKELHPNDEGIPLIAAVLRPMGMLSDTGFASAENDPGLNALIEARELTQGIIAKGLESAANHVISTPRPGMPH